MRTRKLEAYKKLDTKIYYSLPMYLASYLPTRREETEYTKLE